MGKGTLHRIVGRKDDAEMIIEFYDSGKQLLYLTGTKPFFRTGLTLEEAKKTLEETGFKYTVESATNNKNDNKKKKGE